MSRGAHQYLISRRINRKPYIKDLVKAWFSTAVVIPPEGKEGQLSDAWFPEETYLEFASRFVNRAGKGLGKYRGT